MKRVSIGMVGLWTLSMTLLLSGCATTPNEAPVEERGAGEPSGVSIPAEPVAEGVEVFAAPSAPMSERGLDAQEAPSSSAESPLPQSDERFTQPSPTVSAPQSPAVVALLDNADRQAGSGNLDSAAAALERALRIEPRNAILWQRLADVRLKQNQLDQAESCALKSNTLAVGDSATQLANWRIIAAARRAKGDAQGAREAEARAGR